MTRKDFELIASVLREVAPSCCPGADGRYHAGKQHQYEDTVDEFAERLVLVNPRFHVGKFKLACGVSAL